jgi:hypothetical protein
MSGVHGGSLRASPTQSFLVVVGVAHCGNASRTRKGRQRAQPVFRRSHEHNQDEHEEEWNERRTRCGVET